MSTCPPQTLQEGRCGAEDFLQVLGALYKGQGGPLRRDPPRLDQGEELVLPLTAVRSSRLLGRHRGEKAGSAEGKQETLVQGHRETHPTKPRNTTPCTGEQCPTIYSRQLQPPHCSDSCLAWGRTSPPQSGVHLQGLLAWQIQQMLMDGTQQQPLNQQGRFRIHCCSLQSLQVHLQPSSSLPKSPVSNTEVQGPNRKNILGSINALRAIRLCWECQGED